GTSALSRADCAAVLERLGLPASLRTMWERPELAGPWVTLLDGGWLEITGSTVRRQAGPVPYVPLATGGEGLVEFGHAVLAAALFAGGPSGLRLPDLLTSEVETLEIPTDPATGEWDREELHRLVAVEHDLDDLVASGILHREGRVHTGSAAVTGALVALIRNRGEPGDPLR